MPAGNESDRLFVVHRHAIERLTNIAGRGDRIGLAVRSFRIHVNQAHLNGAEMILELAITAVALVGQPFAFGAPVDVLFGLPYVDTTTGEAEGLEPHRLEGDVASENDQIGPGNLPAVLLLDRPDQPTGLVEVHIIRPAVERREALRA